MQFFHILLLIFLTIPVIEIYLIIKVGGVLGAIPTIALIIFTAVLGAMLLRVQGMQTLQKAQNALAQGELPALPLLEGVVLLVCGALLLTPGFFTDVIGFIGLIPAARRALLLWFIGRSQARAPNQPQGPRTIEGEYSREDD